MSDGPPSSRDVVARAQAGDPEAFRVIFEQHAAPVRRFLGDLFRDGPAADEATQETFVRAHARLPALREGEKLQGFLLGIARRVFLEQLRFRRREGERAPAPSGLAPEWSVAAGFVGEGGAALEALPAGVADLAPNPEAALLSAEADRHLGAALALLADERRSALLLRIDHGLGYPEIALAMGWTLQKVKNEIHRARLQLRESLAGYLEGRA